VYVKLQKRWKNKVQGLCGNYNSDSQDDLKSPSAGVENNALLFGHSWKLDESCESEYSRTNEILAYFTLQLIYSAYGTNRRLHAKLRKENLVAKEMWHFEVSSIRAVSC
jgi:hypothetical protein